MVAASPQGAARGSSPSVSLDQLGRPQANALANALAAGNHVKIQAPTVCPCSYPPFLLYCPLPFHLPLLPSSSTPSPQGASQQQIISQVSAALASHGQNVSVAVRAPLAGASAVQGGLLRNVAPQAQAAPAAPAAQAAGQMVNLQLSVAQHQQPAPQPTQAAAGGQQGGAE